MLVAVAVCLLAVSGGDAAALASGLTAAPWQLVMGQDDPASVDEDDPAVGQLDGISRYGEGADPDAHACPIVAFGDSYTWGSGASSLDSNYPSRMERALGHTVVNAGVGGETAEEGYQRIDQDVLAYDPCLVIVEFGTNEAFRGYDVNVALDGMERIVQRLRAEGIPVVIVGTHFANYAVQYDAGLLRIAQQYDALLVLGVLDGILSDPTLRGDAFHPNGDGYAQMWQCMDPVVRAALQQSH